MTSRGRLAIVVALGLLAGCSGSAEAPPLPEQLPPAPVAAPRSAHEPLFGADGELLESSEVVAGLHLPRGLRSVLEDRRRHVYTSDVPLTKVQSYFGVRLVTGTVDREHHGGAVFRDAVPRDARGGVVRLDVEIGPTSGAATLVTITELVPPVANPPPREETERAILEQLERGE